ncbi:MAG TPA: hypothetical protein VNQ73_06220 [Ilumatobacter sp.]|nr:hypothetical protein [Ilumatobacter sp.]
MAAALVVALAVGGAMAIWSRNDGGAAVDTPDTQPVTQPASEPTEPEPPVTVPATTPKPEPTEPIVTVPATNAPSTTSPTTSPATSAATPPEPADPARWSDFPQERSTFALDCRDDAWRCTAVLDPTGQPVTYDAQQTLTRHGRPEVSATLAESNTGGYVLAAGPDDVAYVVVATPGADDPIVDAVAISLADGDAGREIARWPEAAAGDSMLVVTPAGLVVVGCCGDEPVRPDPEAPVVVPWIDRDGQPAAADRLHVAVHLGQDQVQGVQVERDGSLWSVTSDEGLMLHGMPRVTPTFDGGIVAQFEQLDGHQLIVRGHPDGTTDEIVIDGGETRPLLVDASGVVVVPNGDGYVRVQVFEPRPSGWDGSLDVDLETWTASAPGLDEFLDANDPTWESDPVAFADAIAGPPGVAESRTVELVSEEPLVVELTTTGYLDDSVHGDRYRLTLAQVDDTLRLVEADYLTTCQPDRGHQDFQQDYCR